MTKVAVALSGGIDSAVAAALLLEQGYDVIGITCKMTCSKDSETVINNAQQIADKLNIRLFVLDASEEFNKNVIEYFITSYKSGETPNPCIMCNKHIKWGAMFDYAINKLGVDYIATGHYANIECINEVFKLYPATDEHKDQLYFLFSLTQENLAKTLFPLSKYTKTEVRVLAEKYDLPPKSAKESQDICFIKPPLTTKKFLNENLESNKGCFIEKCSGKILGYHNGFWQYTIGQRKGIGLAAPEALYVVDIDAVQNIVYVGYKNNLYKEQLLLKNIHWSYTMNEKEFNALVKIRYNMKAVPAAVKVEEGVKIEFFEPISGITKGQACVLYNPKDGHLIGGGII